MNDINFYKDLPPLQLPITDILYDHNFSQIPPSWHIIIADIKNSTAAINNGRHNDVNLVAAGSLIAALNICKKRNIEVPFFFGGDGGSLLVPQPILMEVLAGLALHNQNSQKYFGLEMHIGFMSIQEVLNAGYHIKITKLKVDNFLNKALIIGNGMQYAEKQIKYAANISSSLNEDRPSQLNLTGLECRWDRVKPPVAEHEVVCYLIDSPQLVNQLSIFRNALSQIDNVFGDINHRHPLSIERLKLLLSFSRLKKEMLAKYGKWKITYFLNSFLKNLFGWFVFKFHIKSPKFDAQRYIEQIISHSDSLLIDGRINTIISGTPQQHSQFLNYLTEQENAGQLLFGHYSNRESVITCYIENYKDKHIHFLDGADGGYTEAAKELKRKIAQRQSQYISIRAN
ncbi:DUF3095 family protein [Flavisolibacter tropicus]|uniref:DUF3095 domain-containing protein n=1 Tax=Flavisolibacter tropicus TaxID=1492898 RepID=A0A172TQV2_9BACT|nr:DUF3095 family protein [Flavisolibacter tropicus]ANE49362.1 hypothetical protein SY85_01435 [Flavisolibacter tropicus]